MIGSLRNVVVHFGENVALDAIDLDIEAGKVHAIIGGDGAGKSTLLKVLARLDVGQRGTVRLPAQREISFVPSHGGIFADLTVAENMEFIADAYGLTSWRPWADLLLDRADLGAITGRISGRMSGGQRRKLAGVMALLPEPALLILDEATTGVDPVSRMELWRLFAGAAAGGAAVVASTSYLDEAERANRVLLLHNGRTLASGSPSDITQSITGAVVDVDAPSDRSLAWRRGRRWRQWLPSGPIERSTPISLEDAAIIRELEQTGARP